MFEFIYSRKRVKNIGKAIAATYGKKRALVPLLWTEHCIECAAPRCYTTCPRFKKRVDGHCIRIVDGITPATADSVLCAECEFRSWAKIESQYKIKFLSGKTYARLYRGITHAGYVFASMAKLCPLKSISTFINDGWFSYRQKIINRILNDKPKAEQLSLIGEIVNTDKPSALLVDIKTSSKLVFRNSIDIPLGTTTFTMSLPPYEKTGELSFLNIHPSDAEQHVKLTFKKLNLVPRDITKGKKVKCVIWDLDNTLWNGILVESHDVELRRDFFDLIKHLDSCGIVNSIASKNNHEQALAKLQELGIDEYFVFMKINWEPKSVNIANTIRQMNINSNTVVLVDDNPFERNEVAMAVPDITCVDPHDVMEFAKCERFNAVVTEDSRQRRHTYVQLEKMKKEEEAWHGDINDFLAGCNIKVEISHPTKDNVLRCYELLQRTNQLNSSGRRLSLQEVEAMIASNDYDCYVLSSSDRFGDYGIVGFMIVDCRSSIACITDFVISCRVANKKIEPTVVNMLANHYGGKVLFNYKKTKLNGPMYRTIEELGMKIANEDGDMVEYCHSFFPDYPKIVTISYNCWQR